jgi:hypothetical protein
LSNSGDDFMAADCSCPPSEPIASPSWRRSSPSDCTTNWNITTVPSPSTSAERASWRSPSSLIGTENFFRS